jgi:rod shape-determining protein MreC
VRSPGRLRLLLVLLVLTALTLTALDSRSGTGGPFGALRRGGDALFGPPQRAIGSAARSVGGALGGLPRLGSFSADNDALRAENDRLRAQLRETDDLRRQRDAWDALLKLKDAGTYTVVPAHVSAVSSSLGFEWTATLDAGSQDGLKVDQTVLDGRGLVGRTVRVGPYTSLVVLVADPDFGAGVRLSRTGQFGIVHGQGEGRLDFQLIGQSARAEVGDTFVTTGSDTFVPGVPVGRVISTDSDPNALTRTGTVAPFTDVTTLDLVGVVVAPPRGTPRVPITPMPVPTPAPRPSATVAPSSTPSGRPSATPTPSRTR